MISQCAALGGLNFSHAPEVVAHPEMVVNGTKDRCGGRGVMMRCAITLCWDQAGLSRDEIAALFRMPSSNFGAQTIRRTKTREVQTLKVLKHQISHK